MSRETPASRERDALTDEVVLLATGSRTMLTVVLKYADNEDVVDLCVELAYGKSLSAVVRDLCWAMGNAELSAMLKQMKRMNRDV